MQASRVLNSLLSTLIYIRNNMRLFELFEAKTVKKPVVPATTPRNYVAKNAQKTGAGAHTKKGYSRKEKHKDASQEE